MMQLNIKHDIKEVTKGLSSMQKKQIPFATMLALNDTAFAMHRTYKAQTKQKFDNPTPYTQKGFRVQKATKKILTSVIFVDKTRENYMQLQVDGGVRIPKNTAIVIPNKNSYKGSKTKAGNIGKAAYDKIKQNKQKYFFGVPKGNQGSDGIWERYGSASGKTGGEKIRQVAKLTKMARYKALFPYESIGKGVAFSRKNGFDSNFAKRLRFALNTAR